MAETVVEVSPVGLSPYRCETCDYFIPSKKNCFGVEQPFCACPRGIEYLKAKPETVVDEPGSWTIKERTIHERDNWYFALSKYDVERIGILGCLSNSKFPKRDRYEAVKV